MNLPNYFFADLPPEAMLSPAMMAESCQTLKRNRAKFLAGRTTDDIIKVLCEVAAEWLSPEDKFRKLALDLGPAETGFSKPILERGLDGFFKQFTPQGFESLLEQELGQARRRDQFASSGTIGGTSHPAMARGPEFLVHITAGNLPNPALMSVTRWAC